MIRVGRVDPIPPSLRPEVMRIVAISNLVIFRLSLKSLVDSFQVQVDQVKRSV
jgi:hypothetical protein